MNGDLFEATRSSFSIFNIIFVIMLLFTIAFFIFVILMIFNPKIRSKMMGRQLKATKMILDDNKETIKDIANLQADIAVESTDNILNKHDKTIEKNMTKMANMSAESIETTARSIKKGISKTKQCPECLKFNEENAKFCQECGAKFKD